MSPQPTNLSFSLLAKYLLENGYEINYFTAADDPRPFARIISPQGNVIILNTVATSYPFASSTNRLLFTDKMKAYDLVEKLGISISNTMFVKEYSEQAETFLLENKPIIVKPRKSQGSKGLTMNIENQAELKAAINKTKQFSDNAILQSQFEGEELRFMVLNGIVEAVLLRQTPQITGDGNKTIAELLELENANRRTIVDSVVSYPMLDEHLITAKLDYQSIPALGEIVELSRSTMISGGASIFDVMKSIHPSYIAVAQKVADHLGKGLFAVDIMTSNPSMQATLDNHMFLEMNGDPALSLCYSCRDGRHFKIVEHYLGPMLMSAINVNLKTGPISRG